MATEGLSAALGALPMIFAFLVVIPPLVAVFYGWMRGYQPVWSMVLLEIVAVILQSVASGVVFWICASIAVSGPEGVARVAGIAATAGFAVGLLWRFAVYRSSQLRPLDSVLLSAVFPALILLTMLGGIFRRDERTTSNRPSRSIGARDLHVSRFVHFFRVSGRG